MEGEERGQHEEINNLQDIFLELRVLKLKVTSWKCPAHWIKMTNTKAHHCEIRIRTISDLLTFRLEVERQWSNVFKILKEGHCQSRILCSTKPSIKCWGELKTYWGRQNLTKLTCCAPFLMKEFALPKQGRKSQMKTLDLGNRKSSTDERGERDPWGDGEGRTQNGSWVPSTSGSHWGVEYVRRHWDRPLLENDINEPFTASEQLGGKRRQSWKDSGISEKHWEN